ncbi:hypothetical protein BOX15_Mlig019751g1 [Macrostomum lignano]|uniref:Uncharacterized protein n=1 Tax=Macrostomum lignano TaxID=282301 RepID=A0A267G6Q2_9PLAT|nr:hypothetical protein BOX15_Mlig019751g1 [Macrostomum lignano]
MMNCNSNEPEADLVLPEYRCANKSVFLCDLIAFVFFIKGQCPSFKEVEKEVKMLVPAPDKLSKPRDEKKPVSNSGNSLHMSTTLSVTPAKKNFPPSSNAKAKPMFTCFASPVEHKLQTLQSKNYTDKVNSNTLFTCYTSPIECKGKAQSANLKAPLLAISSKKPMCEFVHAKDELHVSFINETFDSISMNISIGFSQTFDSLLESAKKSFAIQCVAPSPILHIKRNVHQERMLRCLAEVVPAVLHASSYSDAIMLAFGPSLLSLDQAVLLEFADTSKFEAEQAHDEDDKENYSSDEDADGDESDDDLEVGAASRQQRQLVFSRLLGVSGLADAIPLTSMHVLLRMPRTSAAKTPPSAPFRPRPHFRLRPACKLTRLTLPCGRSRSATSKSASASANDSMWYHSATPVPGYALSEQG